MESKYNTGKRSTANRAQILQGKLYNIRADYGLHPTNERRRYFVTTSLTDWVQA